MSSVVELMGIPVFLSMDIQMPFKHPCTAPDFFLRQLHNHCQCLFHTFTEICTKLDAHRCSFLRSLVKSPHDIHNFKQKNVNVNVQTSTDLHEILFTYFQNMLELLSTMHCGTTVAIQMAAVIPNILEPPSIVPGIDF